MKILYTLLFVASCIMPLSYARLIGELEPDDTSNEKYMVVVIASYNNAQWCDWWNLESVFTQEYKNYHVIYVDDCSTDNTYDLVMKYVDEHTVHDRITVIRNPERTGSAIANHHKAISMVDDRAVIVILDGDDAFPLIGAFRAHSINFDVSLQHLT